MFKPLFNVAVGTAYEALRERLVKRADVPHSVLTSSDWTSAVDDVQPVDADTPAVQAAPTPAAGRPVSQVAGMYDNLAEMDGDLRRVGESGYYSSADDLHRTGLSSAAALKRRFLRSRSHQSLLRLDVRAALSPSGSQDHLVTPNPRLPVRSGRLMPTCVRGTREEPDRLSAPIDLAIRSPGAMILQICGIDLMPSATKSNSRKSQSLNV